MATEAINDLILVFQDWIDFGTPLTTTSDEASKLYDAVLTQVSHSTYISSKKNNTSKSEETRYYRVRVIGVNSHFQHLIHYSVTQTYWGQDRYSDIELLIDTTTVLLICIRKHEHLRLAYLDVNPWQ